MLHLSKALNMYYLKKNICLHKNVIYMTFNVADPPQGHTHRVDVGIQRLYWVV